MTGHPATPISSDTDPFQDEEIWHGGYEGDREAERARATAALVPAYGAETLVLEVGAGSGLVTEAIRARGMFAVAMDLSHAALRMANGARVVGDATRMPLRDGSVDVAVAAEVMEHLTTETREVVARGLASVARSAVVVTVPFKETLSAAEAKCRNCGAIFNAWRHQTRFNRRSASRILSGPFRIQRVEMLGPGRPRIPRWSIRIGQRLGGYYVPPSGFDVCPSCGAKGRFAGSGGLAVRLVRGVPRRLLPSHSGTWIAVVFCRSGIE